MLKHVLGATVVLALCTSGAFAESTWRGVINITKKSAACKSNSFIQIREYRSVLRPRLKQSQDFKSSMSILSDFAAARVARPGATDTQWNGSGNYESQFIGGSASFSTSSGTFEFATSPAVIKSDSATVSLSGTIQNFLVPNCKITVDGDYDLVVD
jgi:hypothetical protein